MALLMMPAGTTRLTRTRSGCARVWPALLLCGFSVWLTNIALASSLDEAVVEDALLGTIAEALAAYGIDVTTNLNSREVMRQRIDQPRLGRFPDLPVDTLPGSDEILDWEAEFSNGFIGGLAILAPAQTNSDSRELTLNEWLDSGSAVRMFVTFYVDDLPAIEKLQQVVNAYSYRSRLLINAVDVALAGELYSTAAQRLALDSREARRYDSAVTELEYLGERVRRNENSLFEADGNAGNNRLARQEPAVFLKETLGDEFNQSTIREIIVPGGVALGESARLDLPVVALAFAEGKFFLEDKTGKRWALPDLDLATLKALFDFVSRSEAIQSDAIVDIDGDGRVRIAATLRDTDAGFAILAADTQPFEYVRNLSVTKSVIIDTAVNWQAPLADNALQFETDFEVRFLSADNMRIAQTRAALEYTYASGADEVAYIDSWGRDAGRLHENLDFAGLGTSIGVVARYAGWIALFRTLHAEKVPFLHGRYAFMKLDKSGRRTPARY